MAGQEDEGKGQEEGGRREGAREGWKARGWRRKGVSGLSKEPQSNECKRLHLQRYYGIYKHRVHALSVNFLPRE